MWTRKGFQERRRGLSIDPILGSQSILNSGNRKEVDDNFGSPSYGHDHYCDNGINMGLLCLALAGMGTMFWVLWTKVTMLGRRKKRSSMWHLEYNVEQLFSLVNYGRISNLHNTSEPNCLNNKNIHLKHAHTLYVATIFTSSDKRALYMDNRVNTSLPLYITLIYKFIRTKYKCAWNHSFLYS